MDIKLDQGLQLNQDDLKKAFRAIGKAFVLECRLLLNQHSDDPNLPHTETGQLARSLKFSVRSKKGEVWLKVKADTRYATALFQGSTRKNGKVVHTRPLFDIVMDRIKPRMNDIIRKAISLQPAA